MLTLEMMYFHIFSFTLDKKKVEKSTFHMKKIVINVHIHCCYYASVLTEPKIASSVTLIFYTMIFV